MEIKLLNLLNQIKKKKKVGSMWDIDKLWEELWCNWGILYVTDAYKPQNIFYNK